MPQSWASRSCCFPSDQHTVAGAGSSKVWPASEIRPKLFMYVPSVMNDFYIFKLLRSKEKCFVAPKNYLNFKFPCPYIVLLELSHTHSFTCCVWLLPHYHGSRNHMVKYYLGLKGKVCQPSLALEYIPSVPFQEAICTAACFNSAVMLPVLWLADGCITCCLPATRRVITGYWDLC